MLQDTELIFSLSVQETIYTCGTNINSLMVQSSKENCGRNTDVVIEPKTGRFLMQELDRQEKGKIVCRNIYYIVIYIVMRT